MTSNGAVRRVALGRRGGADRDISTAVLGESVSRAFAASAASLSVAVTCPANCAITAAA